MVLNADKWSLMLFGIKNELQTDLVSNYFTIKNDTEEKVLRITTDSKLEFAKHLTSITKKAKIKVQCHYQSTKIHDSRTKGHLNCSLIWLFCSKRALHRLNNIHRRSLCFIHQENVLKFITF